MTNKYLHNPFNAIYQDEILLSSKPEIQELNQYAIDLEDKIAGDFNLDCICFEFVYNRLAYVRNGLILAKLKFLKLYKRFGDGTFASFCREQLKITRWQVNDTIKAARVTMELIYAGFEILPTNISLAIALASLVGEELVDAWRNVVENIAPDEITYKSIRRFLFPPTENDKSIATIQIPSSLHDSIHREAAERGMAIAALLKTMLDFFLGVNSHLFGAGDARSHRACPTASSDSNNVDYSVKEQIWQADLQNLINNHQSSSNCAAISSTTSTRSSSSNS